MLKKQTLCLILGQTTLCIFCIAALLSRPLCKRSIRLSYYQQQHERPEPRITLLDPVMDYASQTRAIPADLAIEISAAVHHMVQAVQDYIDYRATVRALRKVDDAALADIGITRWTIKAHARKAVYGY